MSFTSLNVSKIKASNADVVKFNSKVCKNARTEKRFGHAQSASLNARCFVEFTGAVPVYPALYLKKEVARQGSQRMASPGVA